ncbi:cell division protein CrgA [Nocardioides daeguensis]|uniref:Cell division protein CrgA n=1 Tax=Nocardioides daeguensis TaxID=908359 RepID=A0ABP6VUE9_9ACTN|nr:cell division protein CrgA [Nocardioides daeguensis]
MAKSSRLSKRKEREVFGDPERGRVMSLRFAIALLLILGGIAWILYYYFGIRPTDGFGSIGENGKVRQPGGPSFIADLEGKNYLIGFLAFFLGLMISAHPSTPLGRGRGVVVAMLACFLVGLLWICVFYIFLTGNDPKDIPVLNDLGQKNLFVGIGFMAVGFAFATRWE